MKRNAQTATTTETMLKLTKAIKKSDRVMAIEINTFMNLLRFTISNVRNERITAIPKKIPTLFQLPTIVEVRLLKSPKAKIFGPKIILIKRNRENRREETTKAK